MPREEADQEKKRKTKMNVPNANGMGMGQISEDDIFSGEEMQGEVKDQQYYKGKLQEVLDTLETGDIETAKAIIMECLAGDMAEEGAMEMGEDEAVANSIFGGQ